MPVLFISDLHLDPGRPALRDLFLSFIAGPARSAEHLYILGDLFEYWIGDDGGMPAYREEVDALTELTAAGVPATFVPGNRDFLVGEAFSRQTGIGIKKGISDIDIHGTAALILHGDELCTDDMSHQEFRKVALDPAVQARMLALPLDQRKQMAQSLRAASKAGNKPADIVDVNQQAVEDCLRQHARTRMIHGHTHRPAIHDMNLDGGPARRYVLPDWHDDRGGYLRCDHQDWVLTDWTD